METANHARLWEIHHRVDSVATNVRKLCGDAVAPAVERGRQASRHRGEQESRSPVRKASVVNWAAPKTTPDYRIRDPGRGLQLVSAPE